LKEKNQHLTSKNLFLYLNKLTVFYYSKTFGKRLWQINYYEHILRKEEVTESIARYILENPIRKGLVEDFKRYPFLGSFVFDIKTL
jgi:putative transposase